jgi:NADH-quinone oxidoreductase subunit N
MPAGAGLNLYDAAAATSVTHPFIIIGLLLSLAGVFFKMAAVPFHVYAPDVYEGAASPVTGMLGFLPKFAGLLVAAKLLAVFDWGCPPQICWLIWIVSALTMTVGNTLALLQTNVKRILAYSSIAHSGYMLIGLLAGPALLAGEGPLRDGIAAMLFYMVIYGAMNLGAFAVLSALAHRGHAAEQLHELRGVSRRFPLLALAMAVCVFSLMGFPPTAGLLGKVYIFSSAFAVGDSHPFGGPLVVLAVIGVVNSAIGAAYYLRIVAACFTADPEAEDELAPLGGGALRVGLAICSVAMLLAFIWPAPISERARHAAGGLMHAPQRLAQASPP